MSRRYFPTISGMSVYAMNYLREMTNLGHDMVMISQYREDEVGTRIYGGGPPSLLDKVEIHGLRSHGEEIANSGKPADFESDMDQMVKLAVTLHKSKPFDLIHAQYCYPNGMAALKISSRLGIPNVVSIQGGDGHWVGLCCSTHKSAMLAVLNHANLLIIGSSSFADEVCKNHNLDKERLLIIPGAINSDDFRPNRLVKLGELSNPAKLLYHGRVDRRKGIFDLLEALQLVKETCPIKLVVSGIGPDLEESIDLANKLKLSRLVEFTGKAHYSDVPEIYRKSEIFLSPTWSEGFSNTILEAMSSGIPIIAANSVGVVDCIRHLENGLLHEPHNIEDLADKINLLLKNHALRKKLASAAISEVNAKYSWKTVSLLLTKSIEKVLPRKPDDGWEKIYNPLTHLENADLSCKFRYEPHLL